jgi:hypothetical protein
MPRRGPAARSRAEGQMRRYGSRRNDNDYGQRAPVHGSKSSRARANRDVIPPGAYCTHERMRWGSCGECANGCQYECPSCGLTYEPCEFEWWWK